MVKLYFWNKNKNKIFCYFSLIITKGIKAKLNELESESDFSP